MPKVNIQIIERNITGYATDEEKAILHLWLTLDKANRDTYFRMKNIWDSCRIKGYSLEEIHREWELFANQIDATEEEPQRAVRRVFAIRLWMRYAAVIAIILGLTGVLVLLLQSPQSISPQQPQITYSQITVPNGQRTQVILSDGSKVWLNSGTVLRYPSNFGIQNRQIILNGEAGFQVATSDIPFTVIADQAEITVLGTHFNVRNYDTDNDVETTLFEGSVRIQTPREQLTVKPGEVATYRKDLQTANVKQIPDITHKLAWNNNRLFIDGERFEDIARTLERWYDVHITITDHELKAYRYTGKFVYNETIAQVLKVISATTPIQYKIVGNEITVSKETMNEKR